MKMKKILLTAVAALLLVAVSVGGTLAYLTATSDNLVNTFKPKTDFIETDENDKVKLTITETVPTEFSIVPGYVDKKDPVVTISNTLDAWLFVTVTPANNEVNSKKIVDWTITEIADNASSTADDEIAADVTGWHKLATTDGSLVYYRKVPAQTAGASAKFSVLDGEKVSYNVNLTETDLKSITTNPTLTFNAKAIQYWKVYDATTPANNVAMTAEEAWGFLNGTN